METKSEIKKTKHKRVIVTYRDKVKKSFSPDQWQIFGDRIIKSGVAIKIKYVKYNWFDKLIERLKK